MEHFKAVLLSALLVLFVFSAMFVMVKTVIIPVVNGTGVAITDTAKEAGAIKTTVTP